RNGNTLAHSSNMRSKRLKNSPTSPRGSRLIRPAMILTSSFHAMPRAPPGARAVGPSMSAEVQIVSRATEITDGMFPVAAATLAGLVPGDGVADGALYPPVADLR